MTTARHDSPVVELTAHTFDELIASSEVPVVVDIWAPWCGPCHALAPVLDDLAAAHADEIRFAKVDADDYPEVATRFQVMSFPTLLVFERGDLVNRLIGARGRNHLREDLSAYL